MSAQSARFAACSSFQRCTVTSTAAVPTTITTTVTVNASTTTSVTTQTATVTETVTSTQFGSNGLPRKRSVAEDEDAGHANGARMEEKRATTAVTNCPMDVPRTASACSGTLRYASACSCAGITKSYTTLAVSGTTATSTETTTLSAVVTVSTTTVSTTVITVSTCSTFLIKATSGPVIGQYLRQGIDQSVLGFSSGPLDDTFRFVALPDNTFIGYLVQNSGRVALTTDDSNNNYVAITDLSAQAQLTPLTCNFASDGAGPLRCMASSGTIYGPRTFYAVCPGRDQFTRDLNLYISNLDPKSSPANPTVGCAFIELVTEADC